MRTYKNRFPFKIGTTSYIIPVEEDNLVANVKFLAPSFDVIQLLYFGTKYLDGVMSPSIIHTLKSIREENGLSYCIHLPLDANLLGADAAQLRRAMDVLEKIAAATDCLQVEKYVLHIDRQNAEYAPGMLSDEYIRSFKAACEFLACRLPDMAARIVIENSAYDLLCVRDIVFASPCGVCMDAGHLFFYRQSLDEFVRKFSSRITMVHLHGHRSGRDHLAVSELDGGSLSSMVRFLRTFAGTVIVEVFSIDDLEKSMAVLEDAM